MSQESIQLPSPRAPRKPIPIHVKKEKKAAQSPHSKTVGGLVQLHGDFEVVQVVIRVVGVAVGGSKTALKAILKAQGMMQQMISSMSLAMSTNPIPKHEKRVIRLYQSEPFKPTGRPPSYNFKLIYTSEVFAPDELQSMYSGLETDYFGEIYNRDILNPSLVAEVRCQCSMDCRLRLNVYYSSSLTGGKEIVLASTSFSKRELFNAVGIQNDLQNLESISSSSSPGRSDRSDRHPIFVSELNSEFCPGSKAYIEISEPLQPALSDSCFRIRTFPRAAPLNPLKQRYVFYSDADPLSPIIDAEEIVWEPRFAATVAMLFLQSFTASLSRSIHSWNIRTDLERMRQGRFLSIQEAGTYGWQHVTVTVVAARIGTSKVRRERQLQPRSPPALMPDIVNPPSRGNLHTRSSMRGSTIQNTSIVLPFRNYIPVDLEKQSNFTKDTETSTAPQIQPPQVSAASADSSFIAPPTPATSAASVRFRVDDTAPSTFVQINIEDSTHTFLSPIGRTTTEHYSYWPVYGTNINKSAVRKAAINREATAASDTIEKTVTKKINLFDSYETMDVDFMVSNKQSDVVSTVPGSGGRNLSTDAPSRSESSEILREQVLLETEQVSFSAYIPNSSTNVRFDFFVEDSGKEIRIGHCKLPLVPNEKQSVWLPIEILPSTAIGMDPPCEDVEVYVVVSTENDTASNETVRNECVNESSSSSSGAVIVPPFMSESLLCSHPSPKNVDSNSDQKTIFHNYRKTIADCYEWLWFLGFPGSDPLQLPPSEGYTMHSSDAHASSNTTDEPCTTGDTVNESSSEIPGMVGIQLAASCLHPQSPVITTTDVPAVTSIQRRVDYTYPLPWMSSHLNELQELAVELRTILPFICDFTLKESSFRASVLKKQHEVQPLPVNLHYQLFCVRPHTSSTEAVSKKTNDEFSTQYFSRSDLVTGGQKIEVVHSITCGAISPHYLGYKNGGLSYQEAILQSNMQELSSVKHKLDEAINKEVSNGGFVRLDGESKVTQLTADLGKKLLSYESSSLTVGKRRAYAMSQALSIAVNAFLLKLSLLVEGTIPKEESEFWMREPGFLILFEGLLSVVNKERTMLEDTISAVDALRMFRMRLVPDFILKKSPDGPGEAVEAADDESEGDDDDDSDEDDGFPMEIDIEFSGREVLLYIPFNGFQKLPLFIQNAILSPDGAVVKFYPVLFTQGIDIQQTMVTTFGGDNIKKGQAKSVNLQKDVNDKALKDLNAYCFQTRPIHRRRESLGENTVHPLVQSLSNTILESSISMKNVDLLIEVERVCLILGGCRVTFCKSGKDRTGMAITLEQSRQLGERFQCGNSQGRLLRDAYTMRLHGVRLSVAEKNIGKRVYAINSLQAQFLPPLFRPPPAVCEDINIMKKDMS